MAVHAQGKPALFDGRKPWRFSKTLRAWPLFVVDCAAIRDAAHLAEDASLSFWDALIVVSASRSGAARLYTEDLNHGQTILGVEVTNPFSQ